MKTRGKTSTLHHGTRRGGYLVNWWILGALVLLGSLFCWTSLLFAQVKETLDVPYGEAGEQKLLLDVYQPESECKDPLPAIVMVHGGAWRGGNKRDFASLAREFAQKGYVVFSVGYRFAPQYTYPAQLDDVQRAVRWIRAHAKDYCVNPKKIGALGGSAGGHLVALLGLRETRDNSDKNLAKYSSKVQCVVDLFGPTDLTTLPEDNPVISVVYDFIGKKPKEAPDLYKDASPMYHINKKSAPFLVIHGTADPIVPVEQSDRFVEALKKAKVKVTYLRIEGVGHGWDPKSPVHQQVLSAIETFFNQYLKGKRSQPSRSTFDRDYPYSRY